jgi:hypothetical protein
MTAIDFDFADSRADYRVAIIREARDTETHDIGFRDALSGIRTGRWAAKVEAVRAAYAHGGKDEAAKPKKLLPGVLFSGTFSRRSSEALLAHSGLICADLDGLGETVETWFEQITADPHTLACFRSPTGSGLKVVMRIDPKRPHIESFHAAEHYMLEHFGLAIDEKCSDVSRICFVSHDAQLFEADTAEILPYPPPKVAAPAEKPAYINGTHLSPGDDFIARGGVKVPDLLLTHGWTHLRGKYWCRPGKTGDVSASWEHYPNTLHVFSSAPETGLPSDQKGFDPFAIYTHLEHHGDWKAATKALAGMGYGTQTRTDSRQAMTLERVAGPVPTPATTIHRTPFSFTIPPANDKSILLGNRYLNRGDGMVVSSSSGMGKSSMSHQMAADWGLGEPFHGIRPNGVLRSLIVQSEDSDGDIAEVWQSLAHVRQWDQATRDRLDQNIRIISERSLRGVKFIAWLRVQIEEFKPDLVWLNPLQAFIDGDVTDSKDIGFFLREGLNGLNRDNQFGYVIIHHTTKPATGKDRAERLWHEVMYDMAGGAEIINWARAIVSLRPTEEEGVFKAILAKRGRRAGVVKMVDQGIGQRAEPVTTIGLKHASGKLPNGTPIIHWDSCAISEDMPKQTGGGRPPSHHFADYRSVFPPKKSIGLPLNQLQRILDQQRPIKKDALFRALKRWAADGDVEIVPDPGKSDLYRAAF